MAARFLVFFRLCLLDTAFFKFAYTKLAFNSLKMIQNDTVYQSIKQGMIGLFKARQREAGMPNIVQPLLQNS